MTAAPAPAAAPPAMPAPWQTHFVERCAALLGDATGMPPSYARVFAWLIVCEPAEQSVDDLQRALGLSAGAISMATATLVRMGVVDRTTHPGSRRRHYRIDPDGWQRVLQMRRELLHQLRITAEHALSHARAAQPRLDEMRALYTWFEQTAADYAASRWSTAEA